LKITHQTVIVCPGDSSQVLSANVAPVSFLTKVDHARGIADPSVKLRTGAESRLTAADATPSCVTMATADTTIMTIALRALIMPPFLRALVWNLLPGRLPSR
jgi:hypothetical protein